MSDEFEKLMQLATSKLQEIESLDKQKEQIKDELSEIVKQIKQIAPKDKKSSFRYNNRWYMIKHKRGRTFLVDFDQIEPGSWLRKNKKPDE